MPSAVAANGAARARPSGPAITANKSWAVIVSAGGRRTILRSSKGVMMLPPENVLPETEPRSKALS